MASTLHGTTAAWTTTTGFTPQITRIGGTTMSREAVETTHLGTTVQRTFSPADIYDAGECEIEIIWDQNAGTFPMIGAAAETLTITYAIKAGGSTAGTLAGTGFITSVTGPDAVAGTADIHTATLTWKWDGLTDATYVAGT